MTSKKVIAGLALALGASIAPLTSKATAETNSTPKSVEIARKEKADKLKETMKAGASREEMLKYVDFPKEIPIDKDGNFDLNRANTQANLLWKKYRKAIKNYSEELTHYLGNSDPDHMDLDFRGYWACRKLVEEISGGDKEKEKELYLLRPALEELWKKDRDMGLIGSNSYNWWLMCGCMMAYFAYLCKKNNKRPELAKLGHILVCGLALHVTNDVTSRIFHPHKAFVDVQKKIYDTYVEQKLGKPSTIEIIQMNMPQVKKVIEMTKRKSSSK